MTLESSGANGHFEGTLVVAYEALSKQQASLPWVEFKAVMPSGDERRFVGNSQLLCLYGLSVISDIDDTIKISNVLDKEELLDNTFLREFKAVPSMSAIYMKWLEHGAAFHFVSASPWQLYQPLTAFLSDNGFPKGSFHLRPFRLKDSSFLNIFTTSTEYKTLIIEEILQNFPHRHFILIGDNGEEDPEIYGKLARRHSEQVIGVYIRNVTGESKKSSRMRSAFNGVAGGKWHLFQDAAELRDIEFTQISDVPESRNLCK